MNTIALIITMMLPAPNGDLAPQSEVKLFDSMSQCVSVQGEVLTKAHKDGVQLYASCQSVMK